MDIADKIARICIIYCRYFKGKNEILMSVKDFYNAAIPGSPIIHGVGRGAGPVVLETDVIKNVFKMSSKMMNNDEKLSTEREGEHSLLSQV